MISARSKEPGLSLMKRVQSILSQRSVCLEQQTGQRTQREALQRVKNNEDGPCLRADTCRQALS